MADPGMFGLSPADIQAQQNAGINAQALSMAQLDPMQRAEYNMYAGAGKLAGVGAGMLGMVNPKIEDAKQREEAAKGVDWNDPSSIRLAAYKIAQTNPEMAMALADKANARQKELQAEALQKAQEEKAGIHPPITTQEADPNNPSQTMTVNWIFDKNVGDYVRQERGVSQKFAPQKPSMAGQYKLTPEQNEALFGKNGAVTQGRVNPSQINARTASLIADAFMLNPNPDWTSLAGIAAIKKNATNMQKSLLVQSLPEIMTNMVDTGKKIGFSDNRTIGKMQQFIRGEFNDPDYAEYMSQRNDALMTIAGVMRSVGMSDKAHEAEVEAASPTMSPAALDGWLRGQKKSLEPRLKIAEKFTKSNEIPEKPTKQNLSQSGWSAKIVK